MTVYKQASLQKDNENYRVQSNGNQKNGRKTKDLPVVKWWAGREKTQFYPTAAQSDNRKFHRPINQRQASQRVAANATDRSIAPLAMYLETRIGFGSNKSEGWEGRGI